MKKKNKKNKKKNNKKKECLRGCREVFGVEKKSDNHEEEEEEEESRRRKQSSLADYRVKLKETEKKDRYLDLSRELKKLEHESDVYTNCKWCTWYSHWRIIKGTGEPENKRTTGDCPNYYTIEIGQNTEESPGDLRIFAVTQTSVKDHQLTPMWKTLNNNNNDNNKKKQNLS